MENGKDILEKRDNAIFYLLLSFTLVFECKTQNKFWHFCLSNVQVLENKSNVRGTSQAQKDAEYRTSFNYKASIFDIQCNWKKYNGYVGCCFGNNVL